MKHRIHIVVASLLLLAAGCSQKKEAWPKPWGILTEFKPDSLLVSLPAEVRDAARVTTSRLVRHPEDGWAMRIFAIELGIAPTNAVALQSAWLDQAESILEGKRGQCANLDKNPSQFRDSYGSGVGALP